MKKLVAPALFTVLLGACGGATTKTEAIMIAWGPVLNAHLATGGKHGNYAFPNKLSEIDPALTAALSNEDGWGQKLLYRRIRDDKYQLISAGADGEYGNEDDIVVENGVTYDPVKIYQKRPLKQKP